MKKTMKVRGNSVVVIAAVFCAVAWGGYGDPPIVLDGTEVIQDLSGAAGSEILFQIEVPCDAAELVIRTTGGTGDCAIFASRDVLPMISDYEYCDGADGNLEIILVTRPSPGTWYILLYGDTAYAGVKLWARVNDVVALSLGNGIPVTGIRGAAGSKTYYTIEVPEGQDYLQIDTWGGTGDVDLYVKHEGKPADFSCDAQSVTDGAEESVRIDCPEAGTWYVLLYGYSGYDDVSLVAAYGVSDAAIMLRDETPIGGLSGSSGSEEWYAIDVPGGQAGIAFYLHGGTGDCDMYIKRGARPTETDWDYRPIDSGNNESISIGNPAGGRWYVLLKADSSYSGVTLEADYWAPPLAEVTLLENGKAVSGLGDRAGGEAFFVIDVPEGQTQLEISTSGGTGDVDLYVCLGQKPTADEWDYRPYLAGNNETVVVDEPKAGKYYIMLRGYLAYAGVTLQAGFAEAKP